jgi:hypothetical protein
MHARLSTPAPCWSPFPPGKGTEGEGEEPFSAPRALVSLRRARIMIAMRCVRATDEPDHSLVACYLSLSLACSPRVLAAGFRHFSLVAVAPATPHVSALFLCWVLLPSLARC